VRRRRSWTSSMRLKPKTESKRQQLPLQRIEAALNSLKQVTIDEDTDALDALAKALGHVTQQVERLSEQIDKVRSKKKK